MCFGVEVNLSVSIFELILSILLMVVAIVVIAIVLAQQGKDNYLGGAIAGGAAESFLGKGKARSIDAFLTKLTRVLSIVMVLLIVVVDAAALFTK